MSLAAALRLAQAQPEGRAWLATIEPCDLPADPVPRWAALPRGGRTLFAVDGGYLLAQGEVWSAEADGPGATTWLARAHARLEALTVAEPLGAQASASLDLPLVLTAQTFEDTGPGPGHWGPHLPGKRLWLPRRWWWRRADGRGWCGSALAVSSAMTPARLAEELAAAATPPVIAASTPWPSLATDFVEQVADAVDLINDGALRKVVLARAVDEPCRHDEVQVLARLLAAAGAGTTVYAHDLADGGLFCGATPEVLIEGHGNRVRAMALAGSCPRGAHPAEDLAALADMLSSTKQRKEHGLVVEHVVAVLRPRSQPFAIASTPHQRAEGSLIHLQTLVEADLLRRDYLDVIGALHPTPAVCGLPQATAAHYIRRHERLQRGLYAGVLGWLTSDACRTVVPLRGGILAPDRTSARLFAGAGIVETSDPQTELAETELKLAPMRHALGAPFS